MTCQKVFELALSFLGEDSSGTYCEDYKKRAPFILGAFLALCAEDDATYRKEVSIGEREEYDSISPALDSEFPFCDVFYTAAGYYLASMLIFDSDFTRSDILFEKYSKAIEAVMGSIAAECKSTKNIYPY